MRVFDANAPFFVGQIAGSMANPCCGSMHVARRKSYRPKIFVSGKIR